MITETTIKERVNRGANWLKPGWHQKIDLEKLDMLSPYNCILGQLFGSMSLSYLSHSELVRLGFCCPVGYQVDDYYYFLTKEWRAIISESNQVVKLF